MTHKKVAQEALERDELVWATWVAEYGDVPMDACIWLDESIVQISGKMGMQLVVMHVCGKRLFIWGQRFSILPALSVDGIIPLDIFEGSVTKE